MHTARHPQVVRAARLLRDRGAREAERAVCVDGPELLAEARAAGLEVEWVLDAGELAPDALRALSAVGQPPPLVAVVELPPEPAADALPPRSIVLAGVGDAGNVGSILRTAAAFEVPRVVLTAAAADPWSRRALRASLGAAFRPGLVARAPDVGALARLARRPPLAAAVPRGGVAPEELPRDAAVVLGSERDGLPPADLAACELAVTIDAPGFESLNVAAAAAVLAHGLRRAGGG